MELGALFEQAAKLGNSTITLLLLVVGVFVYLAREISKLRTDFLKQTRDTSLERRTAILDIFTTLDELKKHDIQDFELRAIKEQLLKDLKITINTGEVTTVQQTASSQNGNTSLLPRFGIIPDNIDRLTIRDRIQYLLGGLFFFGFGAVWSSGWGLAMAAEAFPKLSQLSSEINSAVMGGHVGSAIFFVLTFLLGSLVYVGIGIIPVIAVAAIALRGFLAASIAVFPQLANFNVVRLIDTLVRKISANK